MRILWRALKVIGLSYLGGFVIAAAHFPTLTKQDVFDTRPRVLVLPIATVGIARAYGQFVLSGNWPFGTRQDVVFLKDLIMEKRRGNNGEIIYETINFDRNSEIAPGKEGRVAYTLSYDYYIKFFFGAFMSMDSGMLLRVGRYFCLMPEGPGIIRQLTGPSDCYELISYPSNRYSWRALGKDAEEAVRLSGR